MTVSETVQNNLLSTSQLSLLICTFLKCCKLTSLLYLSQPQSKYVPVVDELEYVCRAKYSLFLALHLKLRTFDRRNHLNRSKIILFSCQTSLISRQLYHPAIDS